MCRRGALGFWCCGGWDFFDADGVGPLGDVGVSFFHLHSCILHKHLRTFAATPGEIAEEVLSADAVRAGWGIDSCLAAFDQTGQIVHFIPRSETTVCRTDGLIIKWVASCFESAPLIRRYGSRRVWCHEVFPSSARPVSSVFCKNPLEVWTGGQLRYRFRCARD